MELTVEEAALPASAPNPRVGVLVALMAAAAAAAVAVCAPAAIETIRDEPLQALTFLALSLVFQGFAVEVYGKGTIGISAIAMLAVGFSLGPEAAIVIALVTALSNSARRRAAAQRWLFDASNWVLAAGAAALVYLPFANAGGSPLVLLCAATVAGAVFTALNNAFLCLAMSLSEHSRFRDVWYERFHWARFHFLGYGALALALTVAHGKMGVLGVVAFALPPLLVVISVRQYLTERTAPAAHRGRGLAAIGYARGAQHAYGHASTSRDVPHLVRRAGHG